MATIVVITSTTEQTSTATPTATPTTERVRSTSVRSSRSDRLSAWNVRDFVKAMDAPGVPDRALVEVTRSDVGHPTSINVKFSETLDEEAPDGDA